MNAIEVERLEQAWRTCAAGGPTPDWRDFLLGEGDPDELLCLLQIDVEFRARDGLPGLLAERYFDHVRLSDEAQAELIRWEYRQRWKHGFRARLVDYVEAFPTHAETLQSLRPTWDCPRCGHRDIAINEDATTLCCPRCANTTPPTISGDLIPPPPDSLAVLDLRHYELLDTLGVGGMGEVFRTRDPGLGRDLALKVLRPGLDGDPRLEARFRREARITASLQHPAIVPVHNLGRLPDGRLFFSMKLVRGRTLEALLANGFASWLGVFEHICQAVAYAHGQGIIHRDLKPSNVMVGDFGEVQVMDWGLAAERCGRSAGAADTGSPDGQTQAGSVLGTPAYMPPEQARGELADERADVFALGAILCAALTGRPPYGLEALAQARAGDLSTAHANLDACGADPELVRLCKECLAPKRADRPAEANAVAARVATYRQGVEQRLRQAELDRVRAEVQAREQARRGLLRLAVVASVFVLLLAGVMAWGWLRQKRIDADQVAGEALSEARALRVRAEERPLDPLLWRETVTTTEKADALARAGASATVANEAAELLVAVREELEAVSRDRRLLAQLLEVQGQAVRRSQDGDPGRAEADPENGFAAAFRDWGVELDNASVSDLAAKLSARSRPVVREVVAALDDWAIRRSQQRRPGADRLWALASALDADGPSAELRAMIRGNRLAAPVALLAVIAIARPTPMPALVPIHPDHRRLLEMAREPERVPTGLLARALATVGENRLAESLLRGAVRSNPSDVRGQHDLGAFLSEAARWAEAIECYTAARALRPELGLLLSKTLHRAGRRDEAVALASRLIEESPRDAALHRHLGDLLERGDSAGAIRAYRQALKLSPGDATTLNNLSIPLRHTGKLDESMRACRQALASQPNLVAAHVNLASALFEAGQPKESLASADQAIRLDPSVGAAYYSRGLALVDLGKRVEAERAFRTATRLDPSDARAHANLAVMLSSRGDQAGAIASARRAVLADPEYAIGQANLGAMLCESSRFEEALPHLQKSAELNPTIATTQAALGQALLGLGRKAESAKASRRALELLPPSSPIRPHVEKQLRRAEGRK